MIVATVEGVSAASTACESDVRVTMGGRTGGGWIGCRLFAGPSGPGLGGGRAFGPSLAFGEGDCCALPKPPKEPNDPDNLLEKLFLLLCVEDDLLETVDCDQRFKFPMPSLTPCPLSDRG